MTLDELLATLAADAASDAARCTSQVAVDYLAAAWRDDAPVSRHVSPAEVAARFDEPLPTGGDSLEHVLERVRDDVVRHANWLAHPMAMGHQVSPPLPASIWTESIIAALNNSQAVREMSPTLTALERRVVRWMCDAVGWGNGSGGTFTSGGTEATLAALLAARARAMPDAWEEGTAPGSGVVLCGAHTHYAVARAVGAMGLGVKRLLTVPMVDHRMDPRALRERLDALRAEGRTVVAVVATAGCTATGSFDDLAAVADACAPHGVWLHVDGAHGASALLSSLHRRRLHGIERADSLAWDPHKMMLTPLASGMLLVRDERGLERAFAQQAPYLFVPTEEGVTPDMGVRSLQCSRRGDVLKVWVALQRYGADGIATLHDHLCALARDLHDRLRENPNYRVLHEPESNILCFRWEGGRRWDAGSLDAFTLELRTRWNRSGQGWITTTVLDGRRVLRVTLMNPFTTASHLARLASGLDATANALMGEERSVEPV